MLATVVECSAVSKKSMNRLRRSTAELSAGSTTLVHTTAI